jgi:hypothetical protein
MRPDPNATGGDLGTCGMNGIGTGICGGAGGGPRRSLPAYGPFDRLRGAGRSCQLCGPDCS